MKSQTPGIAVIGLGFIGLPLALSYAMKGASVSGIDVRPELVDEINNGTSHHQEYYEGRSLQTILQEQLQKQTFYATTDYEEAARQVDHYLVTVGLPVNHGDPDASDLLSACEALARVLKKGDTVILRSTVVPGTTDDVVRPVLEKSGLKAGDDFALAYSSERIAEGRAFEEFIHMPLAVGGVDEASAKQAKDVLSFVTEADIALSDMKTVETAKVIENIQRDVNIAMVQEFARFAERFGIDTFELIRVANTHKRVQMLQPGPGVGGYCLPNALYYLLPKAKELDVPLSLLETAREINERVPDVMVGMLSEGLQKNGKTLAGSKVAVLGLAMKDFSNDDRISPPHHLVQRLEAAGAEVAAYDPAVPTSYAYKVNDMDEAVSGADALIYVTVQEAFLHMDWTSVIENMAENPVLLDGKNRIPNDLRQHVTLMRI